MQNVKKPNLKKLRPGFALFSQDATARTISIYPKASKVNILL